MKNTEYLTCGALGFLEYSYPSSRGALVQCGSSEEFFQDITHISFTLVPAGGLLSGK